MAELPGAGFMQHPAVTCEQGYALLLLRLPHAFHLPCCRRWSGQRRPRQWQQTEQAAVWRFSSDGMPPRVAVPYTRHHAPAIDTVRDLEACSTRTSCSGCASGAFLLTTAITCGFMSIDQPALRHACGACSRQIARLDQRGQGQRGRIAAGVGKGLARQAEESTVKERKARVAHTAWPGKQRTAREENAGWKREGWGQQYSMQ